MTGTSAPRDRAEHFITDLDPELEVDVDEDYITPYDGGEEYDTFVLVFSHPTNPKLKLDHGRQTRRKTS